MEERVPECIYELSGRRSCHRVPLRFKIFVEHRLPAFNKPGDVDGLGVDESAFVISLACLHRMNKLDYAKESFDIDRLVLGEDEARQVPVQRTQPFGELLMQACRSRKPGICRRAGSEQDHRFLGLRRVTCVPIELDLLDHGTIVACQVRWLRRTDSSLGDAISSAPRTPDGRASG